MVTAPHHLAAQAGLAVMAEGGNAIDAMVAAAATIAVVYPHMNGLGGDGFWQPAMAQISDGRLMAWGTMGGEGQPQTQAAIDSSHVLHDVDLKKAISAPPWLLGRTWGADSATLKIENRFPQAVMDQLHAMGHAIEIVGPYEEMMGHAGALVLHRGGLMEGASDPRSDGGVAAG